MKLKSVIVKNYKSLSDTGELFFNLPDEVNDASGLTVLVGENNSGKSALISTFLKLKKNELINDEDKCRGQDVSFIFSDDQNKKIEIKNHPDDARLVKAKIDGNDESGLSNENFDIVKANRIWHANVGNPRLTDDTYGHRNNFERHAIDSELASVLSSLKDKQAKLVEFNGLLKRVIPDLGDWGTGRSRNTSYIKYKLNDGNQLSIDYALGDGILNLFRIIHSIIFDRIVCIDEPEAFLHPRAQVSLSKIFNEVSKNKQIIIATHSPYILKNISFESAKILHFKLEDGVSKIEEIKATPRSFTEISYKVYGVATDDYHNQLYDNLRNKYAETISKDLDSVGVIEFDDGYFVQQKKLDKKYPYKNKENSATLPTYVRNAIHYPENKKDNFEDNLIESIELLQNYEN